ncbi:MAG TPA: hypothetical protein VFE29_06180 [Terriglobia bacterium]|nr:hypothetical protein [Terriglobia bacterium]
MKKVLVGVLLFLGCVSAHAQSSATIWFYSPADSGQTRTIYKIGGITDRIATLAPGQFFGLPVIPGIHVFSHTQAPARGQSVAVPVNQGQQGYVELRGDALSIVGQERGIQAIQASQPIPITSAISKSVIVAASAPAPGAAGAVSAPLPASSTQAAPAPSATSPRIEQSSAAEPSPANEFRRFEINWNILSYSRQGDLNQYGGTLDLAVSLNERVAIIADVGIHQPITTVAGVNVTTSTYRFGPRFSARHGRRVTTFSQFLAGGVRLTGSGSVFIGGTTVTASESVNGFSMLVGGGVDIGIRPWFAIRAVEGGYSGLHIGDVGGVEGGWSHGFRVSGGIVFRFGQD